MNNQHETQLGVVLGQRYAYATASLVLGITCYIHFLGMEKAILAIVFGVLALKANPAPRLQERRNWAKTGIALASIIVVAVPATLVIYGDRIYLLIDALKKLQLGK